MIHLKSGYAIARLSLAANKIAPQASCYMIIGGKRDIGRMRSVNPEIKFTQIYNAPLYPPKIEYVPMTDPRAKEAMEQQAKMSLAERLNIRFGPNMPTVKDEESPERDTVNFPRPVPRDYPAPTRLYLFPKAWFDFFYPKTGVTGPYLFGAGFSIFMLSKELYIVEAETMVGVWLALLFYVGVQKWGQKAIDWAADHVDVEIAGWKNWQTGMVEFLKKYQEHIKGQAQYIRDQKILFQAKRENIQLQLEAEFRRRQMIIYDAAKRRLDYLVAREAARRKFEQDHMTNWILNSVERSIASTEGDVLKKCIADLKALSKAKAGSIAAI